ncbi:MAG TPA: mercury resistance system transport protein MerF [Kiloniellaceae bacterium]|nr:mercury resistance system transport protein MerF [Kiloniellaceae bacterium]
MKDRLLLVGIIGTVVAAICCFTPVLVILLVTVGLSAAVGYLDVILIPILVIFLTITGYALWRRKTAK